ncbi:MAG: hypothetical protein K0Q51_893 [Rickettsiaceae bacterium]|jgi:hypothetical protein|nr:hypothetical protein [Rickettsiaceae bacterium]
MISAFKNFINATKDRLKPTQKAQEDELTGVNRLMKINMEMMAALMQEDIQALKELIKDKEALNFSQAGYLLDLAVLKSEGSQSWLEMVKLILKAGGNDVLQSSPNYQYLYTALKNDEIELAKLLIKFGAKYNNSYACIVKFPELVNIHKPILIIDGIHFKGNEYVEDLLKIKGDRINELPKLTPEEMDIIVNRVETYKDKDLNTFIANFRVLYNEGLIDDPLYNAVMTKCPGIAKYCIEQIKPYNELYKQMNLAHPDGYTVKLALPAELVNYIMTFLSPSGLTYEGYSSATGFKPGVNDHIITYSWNEEKHEEEPVLTIWGRICEFIDNIE